MHEEHSSSETESLAVPGVGIRHGVGIEDVGERLLPTFLLLGREVRVGGECAPCMGVREERRERREEGEEGGGRERGGGREEGDRDRESRLKSETFSGGENTS